MTARILTSWDAPVARRLVAEDPVTNVFVGSRIDAGILNHGAPGVLWGWPATDPEALLQMQAPSLQEVLLQLQVRRHLIHFQLFQLRM